MREMRKSGDRPLDRWASMALGLILIQSTMCVLRAQQHRPLKNPMDMLLCEQRCFRGSS
jgi:hypothetical protein